MLVDLFGDVGDAHLLAGLAVGLGYKTHTLMLSNGSIKRCYEMPAQEPAESLNVIPIVWT